MSRAETLPRHLATMEGMAGRRYREFVNHLVGSLADPRYLEVGSWTGSTLCAAIHGHAHVTALAIDNWSQFGGPRETFLRNLARYALPETTVSFLEMDFRTAPFDALGPFNIYLFDGPHGRQDQKDGITFALPALDREFVLIVDDWNWRSVRDGTHDALAAGPLQVAYSIEVRTTNDDSHPHDSGRDAAERSDWHNGYFFAVVRQPEP
jgi:hypothetical protein